MKKKVDFKVSDSQTGGEEQNPTHIENIDTNISNKINNKEKPKTNENINENTNILIENTEPNEDNTSENNNDGNKSNNEEKPNKKNKFNNEQNGNESNNEEKPNKGNKSNNEEESNNVEKLNNENESNNEGESNNVEKPNYDNNDGSKSNNEEEFNNKEEQENPETSGGSTHTEKKDIEVITNIENKLYNIGDNITKTLTQLIDENIINNPLIRKEIVAKKVKEYIANIESNIYKEYSQTLHNFYKKINKTHYIDINDNTLYLYRIGEKKYISKIKKPKYIDFKQRMDELEYEIKEQRITLELLYQKLQIPDNRTTQNINIFEKERKYYIELLEENEIYRLYDIIVNNKLTGNYTAITYPSIYLFKDTHYIIENNTYYVDNEIIDKLNNFQSVKLDEYNNIIKTLHTKTKITQEDKNKIIEYLKTKENKEVLGKINEAKYRQNNYINYIVSELPEI